MNGKAKQRMAVQRKAYINIGGKTVYDDSDEDTEHYSDGDEHEIGGREWYMAGEQTTANSIVEKEKTMEELIRTTRQVADKRQARLDALRQDVSNMGYKIRHKALEMLLERGDCARWLPQLAIWCDVLQRAMIDERMVCMLSKYRVRAL